MNSKISTTVSNTTGTSLFDNTKYYNAPLQENELILVLRKTINIGLYDNSLATECNLFVQNL